MLALMLFFVFFFYVTQSQGPKMEDSYKTFYMDQSANSK